MRSFIVFAALLIVSPMALTDPAAQAATAAAPVRYTTADTDIGTLLDDPAARAVLDKHIPSVAKGEQIDMARSLTLKTLQQYAPDVITDVKLAAIDAELAQLSRK